MKPLERTVERITPSSRRFGVIICLDPANAVCVGGLPAASN